MRKDRDALLLKILSGLKISCFLYFWDKNIMKHNNRKKKPNLKISRERSGPASCQTSPLCLMSWHQALVLMVYSCNFSPLQCSINPQLTFNLCSSKLLTTKSWNTQGRNYKEKLTNPQTQEEFKYTLLWNPKQTARRTEEWEIWIKPQRAYFNKYG